MKNSVKWPILLAGGLLVGWLGSTGVTKTFENDRAHAAAATKVEDRDLAEKPAAPALSLPILKGEQWSELLDLQGPDLYAGVAGWLVNASSGQLESFWKKARLTGDDRRVVGLMVLDRWIRLDFEGARRFAWQQDLGDLFADCRLKGSPKAAFAALIHEDRRLAGKALAELARSDLDAATALLDAHPELAQTEGIWDGIALEMSRKDPAGAVQFMLSKGVVPSNDVLRFWLTSDRDAAADWILDYKDGRKVDIIIENLGNDVAAMSAVAERFPPGYARKCLEAEIVTQLQEQDVDAALTRARGQQNLVFKARLLARIASRVVQTDPEAALGLFTEALDATTDPFRMGGSLTLDGEPYSNTPGARWEAEDLITTLLEWDPAATAEAAVAHGGAREGASRRIMRAWTVADVDGVCQWLNGQDPGVHRDVMVSSLASWMSRNKLHRDAVTWANSMEHRVYGGHDEKDDAVVFAVIAWFGDEPEAARAWCESADLSAASKKRLKKVYASDLK